MIKNYEAVLRRNAWIRNHKNPAKQIANEFAKRKNQIVDIKNSKEEFEQLSLF